MPEINNNRDEQLGNKEESRQLNRASENPAGRELRRSTESTNGGRHEIHRTETTDRSAISQKEQLKVKTDYSKNLAKKAASDESHVLGKKQKDTAENAETSKLKHDDKFSRLKVDEKTIKLMKDGKDASRLDGEKGKIRLQFEESDFDNKKLSKRVNKVEKAQEKADKRERKLPKRLRVVKRLSDAPADSKAAGLSKDGISQSKGQAKKTTYHLQRENQKRYSLIHAVGRKVDRTVGKVDKNLKRISKGLSNGEESEKDEMTEKAVSKLVHAPRSAYHLQQGVRNYKFERLRRANKKLDKQNVNYLYKKAKSEGHKVQKRKIKRAYANIKAGRDPGTGAAKAAVQHIKAVVAKTSKKLASAAVSHPMILLGLVGALIIIILVAILMGSMTAVGTPSVDAVAVQTTYPVDADTLQQCESWYLEKEEHLREWLQMSHNDPAKFAAEMTHNAELRHIMEGTDAKTNYIKVNSDTVAIVNYNHEIGHDPYALAGILCSWFRGNEFSYEKAIPVMQKFFDLQYKIVPVNIDSGAWTKFKENGQEITESDSAATVPGYIGWKDEYGAYMRMGTRYNGEFKFEQLSHLAYPNFSASQQNYYAIYMEFLGNMPNIFSGPNASKLPDPYVWEVPQKYYDENPKFKKIMDVAMKYVGYPYVWGGNRPESSFDCSGFVSWVLTSSGVLHTGRLGAGSLYYKCCNPLVDQYGEIPKGAAGIDRFKAAVKPGDLFFEVGTIEGLGPDMISHTGIFVGTDDEGNYWNISAGNPIEFHKMKFDEHFYCFGRLRDTVKGSDGKFVPNDVNDEMTKYWNTIGKTEEEIDKEQKELDKKVGG